MHLNTTLYGQILLQSDKISIFLKNGQQEHIVHEDLQEILPTSGAQLLKY